MVAASGWRREGIQFEMNPWGISEGLAMFYSLTRVVIRVFTYYSLRDTSLLYPFVYFMILNKK